MSNVYPLPCPVCGTTKHLMTEKECGPIPEFNHYQITCTGCGFGMKEPVMGEDEATTRWNYMADIGRIALKIWDTRDQLDQICSDAPKLG